MIHIQTQQDEVSLEALQLSSVLPYLNNIIVIGLNLTNQIIEFNKTAETFFDCLKHEVLDMEFKQFCEKIESEYPDILTEPKMLPQIGTCEFMQSVKLKSGKVNFVEWKIIPLQGSNKNIQSILLLGTNITKEKLLQSEVNNLQKRLESVIDSFAGNHWWKDINGCYTGFNNTFGNTVGIKSREEIIGKTDYELPWASTASELIKNDQEVMKKGIYQTKEEQVPIADGQILTFLVTKAPLYDEHGNIIGTSGTSVDITEHKNNQEKLRIAKEAAELANRTKTEFLENIRHDIRTPLTGIVGFANIISAEVQDAKIKEYVNHLTTSSHALLDLLNEVLEVIHLNAVNIPLAKKKFDLKGKLQEVINLNKAKACQKKLDLIFSHDETIPHYVIGDSTRIHRIILELVVNALNFTEQGSIKIETKLADSHKNKLIIKISVSDTGMGIPFERQKEIFMEFSRLIPSYYGTHKGMGLGLAIVNQFVEELKGEIYVESEVGVGSKFTCVLPLRKPLLEEAFGCNHEIIQQTKRSSELPSISMTQDKRNEANQIKGKNRILVVEDSTIAAMVVKQMLSNLDCLVDVAVDGKIATKLVKENLYDLIFMDIGLPDMDGYETTRRIRVHELQKGIHTPIIALTAHIGEENKKTCLDVGMNAVLSKPLSQKKAEEILNAFIPYRKSLEESDTEIKLKEEKDTFECKEKTIDFELACQHFGGNKELVFEMLNFLLASLPEELLNLHTAYEKSDWIAIKQIAHTLKGGSLYCGTTHLKNICTHLTEAIACKKKQETLTNLYNQLISEIKAVEVSIKNIEKTKDNS